MSETENSVRNNEAESQFQWTADGETAALTDQLKPGSIAFMHTGVPEKLRGQHRAGKRAAAGLELARQKGLTVIPLCPSLRLPQKASTISGSRPERVSRTSDP